MASSKTEIWNMALGHLGISKEIANETERSAEAAACRRFENQVEKKLFRDFLWPFATQIDSLALVEEDPNDEWAFAYRYPSNCDRARRILSGVRNDNRGTKVPYKIGHDDQGILIFTDKEDAQLEYTITVDDVTRWPADFVMAYSYLMAGLIAPRLSAGDPYKLGDKALKLYSYERANAEHNAANEEQEEEQPESTFITDRS